MSDVAISQKITNDTASANKRRISCRIMPPPFQLALLILFPVSHPRISGIRYVPCLFGSVRSGSRGILLGFLIWLSIPVWVRLVSYRYRFRINYASVFRPRKGIDSDGEQVEQIDR